MSKAKDTPPASRKGERRRRATGRRESAPESERPEGQDGGKVGERDTDSVKKRKIFHYFGGDPKQDTAPSPGTPTTPKLPDGKGGRGARLSGGGAAEEGTSATACSGERWPGAATASKTPAAGPRNGVGVSTAVQAGPTWGRLVDPGKQRRWEVVRGLQGGARIASKRVDPAAWARRSYCLSYAPVFQDGRPPGMGSTSAWGWASQSQVFGGTRACLSSESAVDPASKSVGSGDSSGGSMDTLRGPDTTDVLTSAGVDEPMAVVSELGGDEESSESKAEATIYRAIWGRRHRDLVQSKNFRTMVSWLSSSSTPAAAGHSPDCLRGAVPSRKTLLEVALDGQDGALASAFVTLMSLAPATLAEAEDERAGGTAEAHGAVAFALRLYHAGSTWRRVSRHSAPRRQGPGSRLHPTNPRLAAAVDDADDRERDRRSSAEHAAALTLLRAGLVVSLENAAAAYRTAGDGLDDPDPLIALAPREALTAAETRSLVKALGLSASRGRAYGGEVNGFGRRGNGAGVGGGGGGGGGGGSAGEGKDEACTALEQWLTRPADDAKRKSRVSRTALRAAEVLCSTGTRSESGGAGGVLVVRLADEAREAIHRVHAAFFAAARHRPDDVPAILREDLDRVVFGGGGGGGVKGVLDGSEPSTMGERKLICGPEVEEGSLRRPPPPILSSVEVFAEFFRLVCLADAMELAASAGDSGLAYGSLHEASTTLLPSGCPLCRRRFHRHRPATGGGDVAEVLLPPHCDICELSARVVMRGVGLMERDKDYDNAFHYLEILLRASSQRLSVHRPHYWLRLVTDLGHKKRAMEALRACEKALSEARPGSEEKAVSGLGAAAARNSTEIITHASHKPKAGSSSDTAAAAAETVMAEEAAAILPLGEALPLLRRAVRLAVPPLRWRKRPPPELREARLRVMRLDLSWRRAGRGSASTAPTRTLPGGPTSSSSRHVGFSGREEDGQQLDEVDEEVAEENRLEGGGLDERAEGNGSRGAGSVGGSGRIAPGTSLEQAVLDELLAELGPGWKGLHAENSICLGLFALLCWDALFAPLVPASAAVAIAASVEPAPVAAERPGVRSPRPRDSRGSPSGCQHRPGDDGSRLDKARVDDCPPTARDGFAHTVIESVMPAAGPPTVSSSAHGTSTSNTRSISKVDEDRMAEGPDSEAEAEAEAEEGGVFHPFSSPFQSEPSDLLTPAFAGRRRRLLEGVHASLRTGGAEALIRGTWSRHYGKACTGLNWNLFPEGVEGWVTVASAIGPLPLSSVCRNLASNYWVWRHGLPDLFLWWDTAATEDVPSTPADSTECSPPPQDGEGVVAPLVKPEKGVTPVVARGVPESLPSTVSGGGGGGGGGGCNEVVPIAEGRCRWIEVKGPGDSLSCAQEAWIDTLVGAGADFVLLRVEDTA